MPTNAIKLPAALEKFVASQVREGTYRNREAAIVAAVSHQKRRRLASRARRARS
jgi:Arc/MetJ-type ribon-helix-helix transcriptional regulator